MFDDNLVEKNIDDEKLQKKIELLVVLLTSGSLGFKEKL